MRKYFFNSIQGKIVGILIVLMSIMLAVSIYATQYMSQTVMLQGKEDKLMGIASFLEKRLGDRSYDDILADAGITVASHDEKIAVINRELKEITDEVARIYPGLGVGYYSLDLDAILTYGPSAEYGDKIGVFIDIDHPGRIVMAENRPIVRVGTMVRGDIMNAMYPIERNGRVIGYAWANELSTEIEKEYMNMTGRIIIFLVIFFIIAIGLAIFFSRRLMRNVDKIVAGVKEIRFDLTKRIGKVSGELGDVAEGINSMAEHIEKTAKEHEALVVAEATNHAQRDFLARMSHELRTPMNGVLGMTRLAMSAESKEQSMQYLKKIQSSAKLLLGIINDILDFSKIEAGKLEMEKHPFAVREIIDDIRELILPKTEEKEIDFKIDIDVSVPDMAVGDSLKLSQVLLNLIGNAVKFTKKGMVSLTINSFDADSDSFRLECAIKDTGIGMSEDQLKLLFKPFSQADSSTVREFGGTGLGLSISKAFLELMSGTISVSSSLGVGSTFTFNIALEKYQGEKTSVYDTADELAEHRYDGYNVLLAEDNEINREIAVAVLSDFGMKLEWAENGEEAVRMFKENKYHMVFMDIRMPIMDGLEATKLIRAAEKETDSESRIPIIAMTANAMQEDRAASIEAGMDGHISKPLDIDEIKKELYRVLHT